MKIQRETIRLVITGAGPVGFGWQIFIGDTLFQSSNGQEMTEAQAKRQGDGAMRNLGGK